MPTPRAVVYFMPSAADAEPIYRRREPSAAMSDEERRQRRRLRQPRDERRDTPTAEPMRVDAAELMPTFIPPR